MKYRQAKKITRLWATLNYGTRTRRAAKAAVYKRASKTMRLTGRALEVLGRSAAAALVQIQAFEKALARSEMPTEAEPAESQTPAPARPL